MTTEARHKYEYDVDLKDETAPAYVIEMVGYDKRVLELGCGPGSITKVLALRGQCRVTGLERDAEAIAKAAPYCETIVQADLNRAEWPSLLASKDRFDVVVAADVLEHLYDPWTTLRQMVPLIRENGYLVISLPHVGHAAVISCLINGDFQYRDWGLLDRTHLRFFGLRNIEALFAQADLKIIEARYVMILPEDTEFAASWGKLAGSIQDALRICDYANLYQVVIKAVPVEFPGEALLLAAPKSLQPSIPKAAWWRAGMRMLLSEKTRQRIRGILGVLRTKL